MLVPLDENHLLPLSRAVLPTDTAALARFLLGTVLARRAPAGLLVGRIVETEAYLQDDPACHAFRGRTARNASLFLERGHAYVYRAYGTSWMFNVSAETPGVGAGVLIRAVEPLAGLAEMAEHRRGAAVRDLARGPGRLAEAFAIDRALDGADLCRDGRIWLAQAGFPRPEISQSVRIGLTKATDRVLRFFVPGSPFVSGAAWLNATG